MFDPSDLADYRDMDFNSREQYAQALIEEYRRMEEREYERQMEMDAAEDAYREYLMERVIAVAFCETDTD